MLVYIFISTIFQQKLVVSLIGIVTESSAWQDKSRGSDVWNEFERNRIEEISYSYSSENSAICRDYLSEGIRS